MKRNKLISLLITTAMTLGILSALVIERSVSAAGSVSINLSAENQIIRGFGGMNHPEWIGDLTAPQRQTAFGDGDNELGFTILRVYVNEDRNQWYRAVPTAQKAIAEGALVFASPWNPPASMTETFYRDAENPTARRLRHDRYAQYAQHLNDFVAFMKENGVDLYAISIQNEPDYAHTWTWWTNAELVDFMVNYADTINCKVIAPESFQYRKSVSDPILDNPQALANMDILGAHLYGTPYSSFPYPKFKEKGAGKELWMTEVYYPNSDNNTSDKWPEALDVAQHVHSSMVDAEFQAYVWWYIRRQYGPMNENGTISKRGYMMAHFSKFVRPGYVRVDATKNPESNVYISAYKGDDGKVVIVAVNKNTSSTSESFTISGGNISVMEGYRTSANENMVKTANVNAVNGSFSINLPAQSVTTFVGSSAPDNIPELNGTLIKDLKRLDTVNFAGWSIQNNLREGDKIYGCYREYTFGSLPTEVQGAEWIRTHGDSKDLSADTAVFNAGADITAYVAIDKRVIDQAVPSWLSGWTSTTQTVTFVDGQNLTVTLNIYRRDFTQGSTATLGACGGNGNNAMYSVFVKEKQLPLEPLNGRLIKNLERLDLANGAEWSIQDDLKAGDKIFGCWRPYTFDTLPQDVIGAERIQTSGNSKSVADNAAEFTAGANITVYIAFDVRITPIPVWLSGWTLSDMTAAIFDSTQERVLNIYERDFNSGEKVTLGTNGNSGDSMMYSVFVTEFSDFYISNADAVQNGGWLEITNASDIEVSCRGLYLSDDNGNLFLWQMPSVIVRAGETIRVRADGNDTTDVLKRMQTNFDIAVGETVRLTDATGRVLSRYVILDADVTPPDPPDIPKSYNFPAVSALPSSTAIPDPYIFMDGTKVNSYADWQRRAVEISCLYEYYMYGMWRDGSDEEISYRINGNTLTVTVKRISTGKTASFDAVINLPSSVKHDGGAPVVISMHTGVSEAAANQNGYAVIAVKTDGMFQTNPVAADNNTRTGAFYTLYPYNNDVMEQSGTLMAWSWGCSKILDALYAGAGDALNINPDSAIVTGVSRYGKAASVCGAYDKRFKMAAPACSGAGGMAMFRYESKGKNYNLSSIDGGTMTMGDTEPLGSLQSSGESYWFNSNFTKFKNVNYLPFDQYMLACMTASKDRYWFIISEVTSGQWTNPPAMGLSFKAAQKVYNYLGISDNIAMNVHWNGHAVVADDMTKLIQYFNYHVYGMNPTINLDTLKTTVWELPVNKDPFFDTFDANWTKPAAQKNNG